MAELNVPSAAGAEELTDELLLERFTSRREEAAFADLVRRYSGLVWGVCRRVLHHEQDTEDAFQAVFCVLARRAGSIRKRGAVGAWLHAVAYRIALKARAARGRRAVPASNLPDIPASEDSPEWARQELRPILDEEVNRLPEKYRKAFILCYLEGRTNEQAAAQLGCPLGTILSRLSRARERLRARLTRRGLALSAGALTAALASEAAAVVVPPALIQATLHSVVAFTGGNIAAGTLSPSVSALATGFRQSLSRMKWIKIATGLLAVILVSLLLLLLFRRLGSAPVPRPQTDEERIQGTWRLSQVQGGGNVFGPELGMSLVFAGNQSALVSAQGDPLITARFQLDANRTPKEITLFLLQGGIWPGIYQLEGDSLKMCVNQGGPERPTTFEAGGNVYFYDAGRQPAPQAAGPEAGRRPWP